MSDPEIISITYLLDPHPLVDLSHAQILSDLSVETHESVGIVQPEVGLSESLLTP